MKKITITLRRAEWEPTREIIEEVLRQHNLQNVWFEEPPKKFNEDYILVHTIGIDKETAQSVCHHLAVTRNVHLFNDLLPDPHQYIVVEAQIDKPEMHGGN